MSSSPLLLLGDEAVARAALDAGISGVYAYPGTPSTEITEYIQQDPDAIARNIHRQWCANEKTAMEEALGMSYAGKRALVCMKHVGLNVAADPFINAAITGVGGGLVVAVADDPSMHSSQNEQDSRFYAHFASVPLLEPSTQQEAYEMVRAAFDYSEQLRLPVAVRLVTRLAHSRADVRTASSRPENPLQPASESSRWVLLPVHARRNWAELTARWPSITAESATLPWNRLIPGSDRRLGIVACGIAFNYLQELFPNGCPYPVLKIGHYPIAMSILDDFRKAADAWLFLEEGAPFLEAQIRGPFSMSAFPVHGRLDGRLPRTGELSPDLVAQALELPVSEGHPVPPLVAPRPPILCRGCPHADTYDFIRDVMAGYPGGRIFSDIGCYTLGALPPYSTIHTCVDMGAAITMAKGAADAGLFPSLAVIGDSTFAHSGLTGLLDAVAENSPITVIILDNETTGMTGGQESLSSGRLESMVAGLGVAPDHLAVLTPLPRFRQDNAQRLRAEIGHQGVSVLIARRPCIQIRKGT